MGDFGMKISKEGEDVNTSVLADTSFDSRYSSLMLVEKKEIEFTAPQGEERPSGTATYAHGLGYAPLVIATIDYSIGFYEYNNGPIPYNYTIAMEGASSGYFLFSYINMDIDSTNIEIEWETNQYLSGTSYELDSDVDYTVIAYIYGYKLGTVI